MSVSDLRMLGTSKKSLLWQVRARPPATRPVDPSVPVRRARLHAEGRKEQLHLLQLPRDDRVIDRWSYRCILRTSAAAGPTASSSFVLAGEQAKVGSGGVTCLASGPRPGLVSGSREGIITSWATDSGVALQTIDVSQVHSGLAKAQSPAKGARTTYIDLF